MRRIIQITLLLTLAMVGLVACGGADSPKTLNDGQSSPVDEATFTPSAETDALRRPQFLNAYADW